MLDVLVSVIIYAIICFVSFIGFLLYFYAYREMKKTKIIGALCLLLFTIFVDELFWLIMEFYRFFTGQYINILIQPISLAIIKSILAVGLTIFVSVSVRTPKDKLKLC